MAGDDTIFTRGSMPVDKSKKRDRINYRFNPITAMKINKLMETGYFDDKTELIDEAIDFIYYLFVLKTMPPGYDAIVKEAEEKTSKETTNKK